MMSDGRSLAKIRLNGAVDYRVYCAKGIMVWSKLVGGILRMHAHCLVNRANSFLFAAIILIGSTVMSAAVFADALPADHPSRMELVELLRNGDFGALEERFGAYQAAYESDSTSDRLLKYAFDSLADTDPKVGERLSEWVETYPDSFVARTARGIFHESVGWRMRGGAFSNKTAKIRFQLMAESFQKATADFIEAVRLKPKSTTAYVGLIAIAKGQGDRDFIGELTRAGLAESPRSYSIRLAYLNSLVPWWYGGNAEKSFAEVGRFIEEIKKNIPDNSALTPLLGFDMYLAALILKRSDRYDDAHEYIDKAIRVSNDWLYLETKATIYYYQDNLDKALEYYNMANEKWPDCLCVFESRARIYAEQERFQASLDEWDRLLAFDPYNSDALGDKAYRLKELGRYEEALEHYDRAMVYGTHDPWLRAARGRLLYTGFQDFEAALEDFDAALAIDPGRANEWSWKAGTLYNLRNCDSKDAYRTYLELCENGSNCEKQWIDNARRQLDDLTNNWCPDAE